MEPRELWERHAVLAVAFCGSDDQVRDAQGILDEAQASRTRMLAAFAVTVGSDGAVADLLGLTEREVRIARRTVGKDDARTVAECLLTVEPADQGSPQHSPAPAPLPHPEPVPGAPAAGPGAEPVEFTARPAHAMAPPPVPAAGQTPALPATDGAWSAALDAVLVGGWHTGLDLTALASEFGLELAHLVARVQKLSAEGRLNQPAPHEDRAGRHRRLDAAPTEPAGYYSPGITSGQTLPYPRPNDDVAWQQAPPHTPPWDNTTTAQSEWNGIVNHWNATPPAQPWDYTTQHH
ncbi:hypothetical protein [Streptomyces paludis]|uniref:hypothetical protein n=1 Tax=Streptomyces paludis TaxID=2282738 RepID=UPI0015F2D17A|nr:hypothetical protein [Streptomyces paludis]